MCQAVASWPSEQPTVSIFIRDRGSQWAGTTRAEGRRRPGRTRIRPDVEREVVIDGLPLDRLDEVHLRRLLAVQLAVEEIDHDLAGELLGRRLPRTVELEDMGTRQDEGSLSACCG